MWNMPRALAGTEAQEQKSIRDPLFRRTSHEERDMGRAIGNVITGKRKVQSDERYRNSQTNVGWTEEHCRYLVSSVSVDISYVATWSERSRYESNLTLGVNDGPLPGPTKLRPDFPRAVRTPAAINHQEGSVNPYIPKYLRKTTSNQ